MAATPQKVLTLEPCTLVYTLVDPNVISFDDFALIIRSLHSYMVQSITPNPGQNNVHVKLGYQASIANAQTKLGMLKNAVHVSKLGSYVDVSEFSHLEQLRRTYGIGAGPVQPVTQVYGQQSYGYPAPTFAMPVAQPIPVVQPVVQSGKPAHTVNQRSKSSRGGKTQRKKCFPVRSAPYKVSQQEDPECVDLDYEDSQAFPGPGQDLQECDEPVVYSESVDGV